MPTPSNVKVSKVNDAAPVKSKSSVVSQGPPVPVSIPDITNEVAKEVKVERRGRPKKISVDGKPSKSKYVKKALRVNANPAISGESLDGKVVKELKVSKAKAKTAAKLADNKKSNEILPLIRKDPRGRKRKHPLVQSSNEVGSSLTSIISNSPVSPGSYIASEGSTAPSSADSKPLDLSNMSVTSLTTITSPSPSGDESGPPIKRARKQSNITSIISQRIDDDEYPPTEERVATETIPKTRRKYNIDRDNIKINKRIMSKDTHQVIRMFKKFDNEVLTNPEAKQLLLSLGFETRKRYITTFKHFMRFCCSKNLENFFVTGELMKQFYEEQFSKSSSDNPIIRLRKMDPAFSKLQEINYLVYKLPFKEIPNRQVAFNYLLYTEAGYSNQQQQQQQQPLDQQQSLAEAESTGPDSEQQSSASPKSNIKPPSAPPPKRTSKSKKNNGSSTARLPPAEIPAESSRVQPIAIAGPPSVPPQHDAGRESSRRVIAYPHRVLEEEGSYVIPQQNHDPRLLPQPIPPQPIAPPPVVTMPHQQPLQQSPLQQHQSPTNQHPPPIQLQLQQQIPQPVPSRRALRKELISNIKNQFVDTRSEILKNITDSLTYINGSHQLNMQDIVGNYGFLYQQINRSLENYSVYLDQCLKVNPSSNGFRMIEGAYQQAQQIPLYQQPGLINTLMPPPQGLQNVRPPVLDMNHDIYTVYEIIEEWYVIAPSIEYRLNSWGEYWIKDEIDHEAYLDRKSIVHFVERLANELKEDKFRVANICDRYIHDKSVLEEFITEIELDEDDLFKRLLRYRKRKG
ncbi:uncharacterized protein RJT21DRAFT_115212 [Scheffersomyces amazonensis]|uniref:uncharacterized protein n=1 Tax=Scheffersomyces amazonensis TaxID=1078765 RepID=UPI00315C669B